MPTLDTKFDPGDVIVYEGRFVTILDVVEEDGTTQYRMAHKGKFATIDTLKVERKATLSRWYDD
ncbi:hypothetical protein [Salinibacter phage M31CR41-2]|uniref:Uncharacterized protein n=2 Tax=Kairosalinivirus TaxID=2560158 RepID=A0A2I6UH98_9CAUD|nr:hypothetical protein FGG68_gp09 [Salinibacter phage M31CR41-2]YP_009639625.1 hypothetical protein FGG69_gp13 [Salinibacter phage SRUTV-1]ATU47058.1 hypothetical protein [Salinibacter phage SRUTV-1]AUO79332.1 hypothetical protein [Salinibacter phage M31CR41-2]AUO79400.1 hypothetical protein [Salinibacter virus M31CR41-3]